MPSGLADLTNSLICTFSLPKKGEDFVNSYEGKYLKALALADGVGSAILAKEAARCAVESFIQQVEEIDRPDLQSDFKTINGVWQKIGAHFREQFENYKKENSNLSPENAFRTTLLTLVETKECYIFSYLGNGSLWVLRGDFGEFIAKSLELEPNWPPRWPWSAVDIALVHSIPDVLNPNKEIGFSRGWEEVLYGYLGPNGCSIPPNIFQLSKDQVKGEVLLLCTDGLSSADQRSEVLKDRAAWKIDEKMLKLITALANWLREARNQSEDPRGSLQEEIDQFFQAFQFDDDASLGVLISEKVLEKYGLKT